jgi:hypothetical protein
MTLPPDELDDVVSVTDGPEIPGFDLMGRKTHMCRELIYATPNKPEQFRVLLLVAASRFGIAERHQFVPLFVQLRQLCHSRSIVSGGNALVSRITGLGATCRPS